MNRLGISWLAMISQSLLGVIFYALTPLYATTVTAGILYGLVEGLSLGEKFTWVEWVIVSPIIYISWLNSFLIACAIDVQVWRPLFRFQKPKRISTAEGFPASLNFYLAFALYMRESVVASLPLTGAYLFIPYLRHLVFWSYSPGTRIAFSSKVVGRLFDPDLTEIGEHAIIGSGSMIAAHSFTTNADGSMLFVTAPITIGPRSVIAGNTRVDLGVRIGADSLVEPASYVAAFTMIGDGEVWGGNPARFLRWRYEPPTIVPSTISFDQESLAPSGLLGDAQISLEQEQALREIVATALDRPLSSISADFCSQKCAAWDSLGQLGISAGLQQRFGIMLTAQEGFRLKSLSDLRQLLRARMPLTASMAQQPAPSERRAA
jgi:acetyltransferase-like isoleucine patch superfamily enzyme/acyl carrier protein